ncbi:hydratase [Eubacterium sp.]|uniref:hydratase n=1 Tax=Eubacterium sp. TaxID=142586 RepID=UPI00258E0E5F|nr:hydratase [Eubacterium sp.]MCR5368500.1 hydratase [Eubacterium sp.]
MELINNGIYLINGKEIVDANNSAAVAAAGISDGDQAAAARNTIASGILDSHNREGDDRNLKIKFDMITSHDITYVGIIQTARASGLKEFPIPYVLTNCHNSLCAVGGTINEDDHFFGLSCAAKYGGIYVPPHQAVIHQFAREMLAGCGRMILGSDSHTRYGALGTIAIGEGGGELAKQLLNRTYDIKRPEVVCVYLEGDVSYGVGPHDVALALVAATFDSGFVKNKILEFVGPGVANLSVDFRIGVDVMTTETTCLSSIWKTDSKTEEWLEIHGRKDAYRELKPGKVTYYDSLIKVDLSKIKPMIAMPFHPSKAYPIADVKANLSDYLRECEERAKVSFGDKCKFTLTDKIKDGKLYVEQGVIAGCAGGGFENIMSAASILKGADTGNGLFSLSVYPASMPVYMELVKNGAAADLIAAGAVIKTAFCGPCFGAGDTPANNSFSIRHSTRNFPNREGSKIGNGQIASVALMDARSIAATAVNKGFLTGADELEGIDFSAPKYFFDKSIYDKRVLDCVGKADPTQNIRFGPNIKDWPEMEGLGEDLLVKCVSVINDPVTTTDELIPSGETSSYRSNPLGLAEFTLSRKDPEYVGEAKSVRDVERKRRGLEQLKDSKDITAEYEKVLSVLKDKFGTDEAKLSVGSTIYALKPGDGSAREQAASCQKVLGAWANLAGEYATKRYRSNLINWGMLPFLYDGHDVQKGDYVYIPGIKKAVMDKTEVIKGYIVGETMKEIELRLGELTDEERQILVDGCLINHYKNH